jgi:hypothetical protein
MRPAIDSRAFLIQALEGFIKDPPDTDFQLGYLSALLIMWREGFGFDPNHAIYRQADAIASHGVLEEGELH